MKNEKGFALVITLLITAVIVSLLITFIDSVYVSATGHSYYMAAQQASIMAETASEAAAKLLGIEVSSKNYTSLQDFWAVPRVIEDERGKLELTITEESAKLNINQLVLPNGIYDTTFQPMFLRLFNKTSVDADILESAADWIDKDNEPRSGGAESAYYSTLNPPKMPANRRFETVEELMALKGFNRSIMEKIKGFVTVYSDSPSSPVTPVNINTAPKEVLMSLHERITEDVAERIIDHRNSEPFKSLSELGRVPGMESISIALAGKTAVKGSVYRITARCTVKDSIRIVESVVRISPAAMLYWREY